MINLPHGVAKVMMPNLPDPETHPCNPLMFALPETPTKNLHNYFMVKLKSSCDSLILEPN